MQGMFLSIAGRLVVHDVRLQRWLRPRVLSKQAFIGPLKGDIPAEAKVHTPPPATSLPLARSTQQAASSMSQPQSHPLMH